MAGKVDSTEKPGLAEDDGLIETGQARSKENDRRDHRTHRTNSTSEPHEDCIAEQM